MEDRQKCQEITLSNAAKMKKAHDEGDYSFDLFGVAQGWDPDSSPTIRRHSGTGEITTS